MAVFEVGRIAAGPVRDGPGIGPAGEISGWRPMTTDYADRCGALGDRERRLIEVAWPEFVECVGYYERRTPKAWARAREQIFDVALDALIRAAKSFRPESAHPRARDAWTAWWRVKVRFGWLENRRKFFKLKHNPRQWSLACAEDLLMRAYDQDRADCDHRLASRFVRALCDDRLGQPRADEDQEYVEWLLGQLPRRDRDLLRAVYLDGITQIDVAKRMGVTASYVCQLLASARARLRTLAETDGIYGPP